jgi:Fe-S cluster biosynthesis and repair protein YggX
MGIDVEVFLRTLLHSLQNAFYLFVLGLGDAWLMANNPRWGRYRFLAASFWPFRKKLKGLPWSEILRIFQALWNEGKSGTVRRRDSDAIRKLSALVDKTFDRETRREIKVSILSAYIWYKSVLLLFKDGNLMALPHSNWAFWLVHPPDRYRWLHLVYYASLLLCQTRTVAYVFIRPYLKICRIVRVVSSILQISFELLLAQWLSLKRTVLLRPVWIITEASIEIYCHLVRYATLAGAYHICLGIYLRLDGPYGSSFGDAAPMLWVLASREFVRYWVPIAKGLFTATVFACLLRVSIGPFNFLRLIELVFCIFLLGEFVLHWNERHLAGSAIHLAWLIHLAVVFGLLQGYHHSSIGNTFLLLWDIVLRELVSADLKSTQQRFKVQRIFDAVEESEEEFIYTELEDSSHIRLLILHRKDRTDAINCTLFEVSKDTRTIYEAVSYTWGDASQQNNIRVNGRRLSIPRSAYKILETRSSIWRPRVLWIDSICINQRDESEKVGQIKLMGQIYKEAYQVSICMQPPNNSQWATRQASMIPTSDLSISTSEVAEYLEAMLAHYMVDRVANFDIEHIQKGQAILQTYGLQTQQPLWIAFQSLLRNAWFDRVWVVQEVALASIIRVYYGKIEIQWKSIVDAVSVINQHQPLGALLECTTHNTRRQLPPSSTHNLPIIHEFHQNLHAEQSEPLSFASIMYCCSHFKATDPRDKIFGIQGFSNIDRDDHKYQLIAPTTKKSIVEVFKDAAKYLLYSETRLRLLSFAGIGYFAEINPILSPDASETLPSWCPDWTRQPRVHLGLLSEMALYRAGRDELAFNFPRISSRGSLILDGQRLDLIAHLGPILMEVEMAKDGSWSINEASDPYISITDTWTLLSNSDCIKTPYPYTEPNQPLREAFWRTLIGDLGETTRPAPDSCGECFEKWLKFGAGFANSDWPVETGLPISSPLLETFNEAIARFAALISRLSPERRLCITNEGYIGMVPPYSSVGDVVCLISGARVPYVFRPTPKSGCKSENSLLQCHLVGEAYVHGVMDGNLIKRNYIPVIEDFEIL